MTAQKIDIYQVDAFTDHVFGGNPAAVCPLDKWLDGDVLQKIAFENNLSETAFFCLRPDGDYDLRWFTPTVEVDLCGHATLATAFVIFNQLGSQSETLKFHSASGPLLVTRDGELLDLDFPARPPQTIPVPDGFVDAVGAQPIEVLKSSKTLAIFESVDVIARLSPDMNWIANLEGDGLICSAVGRGSDRGQLNGKNYDFVSRYFAPHAGIDEDPVTGSAHSVLIPYWSKKLKKKKMIARQISARGGTLYCLSLNDRVHIAGQGVLYLKGEIFI